MIVPGETTRGQRRTLAQTIAVVPTAAGPTVNLGCVCLTNVSVTLVLVAPAATKSCRCGARTIATTVACAAMGNVFVIWALPEKIVANAFNAPKPSTTRWSAVAKGCATWDGATATLGFRARCANPKWARGARTNAMAEAVVNWGLVFVTPVTKATIVAF